MWGWLLAATAATLAAQEEARTVPAGRSLELADVLRSINGTYPPLLAARIETEIREGRLRSARSIYDFDLFGSLKNNLDGFYEYSVVEAGAEQFLGLWGSTVYGGYRLSTGELLPDYYWDRTQDAGELSLGIDVPLLKGRAIDPGRAALTQANVDLEAARPVIDRQILDFRRAGTVAYFKWLATGLKLRFARELLRIANDRTDALEAQVQGGLQPEIVLVDNRRLVVSREIAVVEAEREFEVSALTLSLFFREVDGTPRVVGEDRLPSEFPGGLAAPEPLSDALLQRALEARPELALLRLELDRLRVDERLASNELLPKLDATLELSDQFGDDLYKDREEEVAVGVKFQVPAQRRKARGKLVETRGKIGQIERKLGFAGDKVIADVNKAWVALRAAFQQTERANLNVELARQLQAAEQESFRLGASDLLALQIRERSLFDAQAKAIDAFFDYFAAQADLQAATAEGL